METKSMISKAKHCLNKIIFINPTTNMLICLKSLSACQSGKKKITTLWPLHLDLLEIKIRIDWFKSQRVRQDEVLGQDELTGCPFMSSVEKQWVVDTPPCQIKDAFHVNILLHETNYRSRQNMSACLNWDVKGSRFLVKEKNLLTTIL